MAIEPEGEALTRMIRAGDREGDRGGASSREWGRQTVADGLVNVGGSNAACC